MTRDDPSISAKDFLLTVMHDRSLPLSQRIRAAADLLPYTAQAQAPVRVIPADAPEHNVLQ